MPEALKPSERIEWIDFARGIGIVLVVVGHTWRGLRTAGILQDEGLYTQVDAAIYLFHMPLFFCLSGLTFAAADRRRGGSLGVYASLAWRCLYPLTLWTYLFVLMRIAAGQLVNTPMSWSDLPLFPVPPLEFLWFLWAIFLIQLVMTALHRAVGFGWTAIGLGAAVFAAGLMLLRSGLSTPLMFQLFRGAILYMPFFLIGMVIAAWRPLQLRVVLARPLPVSIIAGALLAIPLLWAPQIMQAGGLQRWIAGGAAVGLVLILCAGLWTWLIGSAAAPILRFVRTLGLVSLAIYLAHVIASAVFRIGASRLGMDDVWLHLLFGSAVGLVGPLILYELSRRFGFQRWLGF